MLLTALLDRELRVVLRDLTPLEYDDGGSESDDRPRNVRAASAVRRQDARLVIVQDDANVLGLHGDDRRTRALLLPRGAGERRCFDDARGNKADKMDLEACVVLPDSRVVAFGSGSTARRRQLVIAEADGAVRVVDATAFYAALEHRIEFAGSELNLEGAIVLGDVLRLFQRGNGEEKNGLRAINATGDVSLVEFVRFLDAGGPAPLLHSIVEYELGSSGSARYGFTDATVLGDGRVGFVACAEDSPDVTRDGAVSGCRFGLIEGAHVRVTDVVDPAGDPVSLKLEGIEARGDGDFDVVADVDDPSQPALLGRLELRSNE
jgi:hypothetical protein